MCYFYHTLSGVPHRLTDQGRSSKRPADAPKSPEAHGRRLTAPLPTRRIEAAFAIFNASLTSAARQFLAESSKAGAARDMKRAFEALSGSQFGRVLADIRKAEARQTMDEEETAGLANPMAGATFPVGESQTPRRRVALGRGPGLGRRAARRRRDARTRPPFHREQGDDLPGARSQLRSYT